MACEVQQRKPHVQRRREEEDNMAGFNYKNINHKRSGQDDMVLLSQVKYLTMP